MFRMLVIMLVLSSLNGWFVYRLRNVVGVNGGMW